MKIDSSKLKSFEEQGITFLKNFLSLNDIEKILKSFFYITSKYIKISKNIRSNLDIENQDLHNQLINLRTNEPDKFSDLYDEFKLNASIRSLFYSEKFLSFYASLLKANKEDLFINGFMLRLDAPMDKKNSLGWHQDSPYYMQTYPDLNGAVCWLPLTYNSENNGTLIYIPSTHGNVIKPKTLFADSDKLSTQHSINPSSKQFSNIKNMNGELGDMTALHLNIIHKSGINTSPKIRITLACRYHDTSKNFNLGQDTYLYKSNGKRILKIT